jgi:hypothetical protein
MVTPAVYSSGTGTGTAVTRSASRSVALDRLDVLHSSSRETSRVSSNTDDVDIEHSLEVDSEVADRALSPALLHAFRDTPLLMLCAIIGSLNFLCYGYDTGQYIAYHHAVSYRIVSYHIVSFSCMAR